MSFQHENYDPPHGEPDPGRWQVHLALPQADRDPLQRLGPAVVPAERLEFHTELVDGRDGDEILAVLVDAATANEAADAAQHLYSRMRVAAGLPNADATILGYISPWWHRPSVAARLGQEANQLLKQGRDELSVLRLQTAAELHIREALTRLLEEVRPDAQADRLLRRGATLTDRQSQALVHLVTGIEVQRMPWWQSYDAHVKRRNAIAHGGVTITDDEAVASFEAVLELREWLLDMQGADADGPDD